MDAQFGMIGTQNATSVQWSAKVGNACLGPAPTARHTSLAAQQISEEEWTESFMMSLLMMATTVVIGKVEAPQASRCTVAVVEGAHSTETIEFTSPPLLNKPNDLLQSI